MFQPEHRRGKKGKAKKLKGKYADQDEDERKLRMQLLGHKEPAQKQALDDGKLSHHQYISALSIFNTRHAMQTKARLASTESDGALDVAQPRAETRAAAKLARTEESEGVAEILKEEGLLDVDAMQQLDILVSP
jgi:hypothetical protein